MILKTSIGIGGWAISFSADAALKAMHTSPYWANHLDDVVVGIVAACLLVVLEGDIQSCGQQHIILLLADGRIGNVDITESILPPQPLVQLGHRPKVEYRAIFPNITEVRISI